jgi:uncharacterized protein (DUF2342 family)
MDITTLLGLVAGWLVLTTALGFYGRLARDQKLSRELDQLRSERQSELEGIATRIAGLDARDQLLEEGEAGLERLAAERTKGFHGWRTLLPSFVSCSNRT